MDKDAVVARLADVLSHELDAPVAVTALQTLAGGACQELYRLQVEVGTARRQMVLRADAASSLPGSLGRRQEYAVIRAAVQRGVKTPAVRALTADLVRPGSDAYVMDWADGVALGSKVIRSPTLAATRARLPDLLAVELARIHTITPETEPDLDLNSIPFKGDAVSTAVAFLVDMLDRMPEPHPAMEFGLKWCRDHAPDPGEVVLVHGDFRTGNFLLTPDGLSAVLDWEFAHWGDPHEDIAWLCMRDWRFGKLDLPVGGFAKRAAFYDAYAAASGRHVDPALVHFWEVVANLRWAAGAVYQGERYLSGQDPDFEYLAIARRVPEMEYEILRLIETGPEV